MNILPLTYLGNTEWWALLLGGEAVIDVGEHYVKQTCRNRAEILTADGVMVLTVNVVKGSSLRKKAVAAMEVAYSKRWQHQHRVAIESAYRSSPYYDYYADRFAKLYDREWRYLVELNYATLETVCSILKCPVPRISENYIIATESDIDLRDKKRDSAFAAEPYIQVFSDRLPFTPNLSIFDLVMCEGPAANDILLKSKL